MAQFKAIVHMHWEGFVEADDEKEAQQLALDEAMIADGGGLVEYIKVNEVLDDTNPA